MTVWLMLAVYLLGAVVTLAFFLPMLRWSSRCDERAYDDTDTE